MELQEQLIFLFSAFGALNGLLLSGDLLIFRQDKRVSHYLLGALLLMMSIRIIKSVFLYFNRELFEEFIQVGLIACFMIGPFLLLYVISMTKKNHQLRSRWWWFILPHLVLIVTVSWIYPYYEHYETWGTIIELIYTEWLIYVLISGYMLYPTIKKIWDKEAQLAEEEKWLLNVYIGTAIVYLAYDTSHYTSYIAGALSFSFIFYLSVLLFFYRRKDKDIAIDKPIKYAGSSLSEHEVKLNLKKLHQLMKEEKPYLDPELSLATLGEKLGLNSKETSQLINQGTPYNYSKYISSLRVEEAQKILASEKFSHYKISAIAYDSGFNSLSSFNASFKEFTGMTANTFRKKQQEVSV